MKKVTFLIVDDSPMWRKVIRRFIEEKLGGKVIAEAEDGIEAVKLYKRFKPDVVTMDIEMPKLDGISAMEEILKFNKSATVIIISSKGEEDVVRKALLKGARDFIVKNLEIEKWTKRFEKVIKEVETKNSKISIFVNIKNYINRFKRQ
ncbi:two-component system chemotaxis response regulator CheY [Caldicellulosiruptor bescii]|uniref:Response regulator receiver protein n=2 Tax=Caldicellulosiruptor bescii TaxID=31899 RepID=B9MPE8_CALBD|nr:response regulator [Caldicellulosiruptor bescii]ACM59709.1 response regulator receiver protein [Caldicellulosiruptor bescii DSM 6725]PBC89734.1 two-component system chemotaxis response regulator CheY [Caldicellulosiruptor bescii]PBC90057.1 two-component system chemotaxis response regulator CheY [Caldicellulosiruptor bescii]PBD04512.1 two-component system chemotaxis response regulator CheY [Caldicellulosiruptor bescii]PBD05854.1 two-component system chemotaxis response regulator CheY [Caldic